MAETTIIIKAIRPLNSPTYNIDISSKTTIKRTNLSKLLIFLFNFIMTK